MALPSSQVTSLLQITAGQKHHWLLEWLGSETGYLFAIEKMILAKQTTYQKIEIYQTNHFGKILFLDGDPQSSEYDEYIYHETLVHPALLCHGNPSAVLILGGGEGGTLREALRHSKVRKVTMVEIDQEVVELCKQEFTYYSGGILDDARVNLVYADAKDFVHQTEIKFDCVISDLTDPYTENPSSQLLTAEFFQSIKKIMRPDGVFVMQASYAGPGLNQWYGEQIVKLKKIWKTVRPFHVFVPSFFADWGFIFASDKTDPLTLKKEEINTALEPFAAQLRCYDGEAHQGMFCVSKELRQLLKSNPR